jgi:hypothetical protein
MGGAPSGPSRAQIEAEQKLRLKEMQMDRAMFNEQMTQQMKIYKDQKNAYEAERKRIEQQQKQAAIESANAAAQQLRIQQESKAQEGLSALSNTQQISDQNKLEQEKQAQMTAGTIATGGGYNLGATRQKALFDMGAMPNLPTTEANNPTANNAFVLPKTNMLQFGGS